MDKKVFGKFNIKVLFSGARFFLNTIFGVFCIILGIYMTALLAKSGSDLFYYAMAFASPGTAIEFLSEPAPQKEPETEVFLPETEILEEPEEVFPSFEVPEIAEEIPENRKGKISETQYSSKEGGIYVAFGNAIIKNCTHHSAKEIKAKLEEPHSLSLHENSPQFLIYHTHATEGFEERENGFFDTEKTWRTTDPDKNMISVGDVLTSVLTENGFGVIHDGTMHDDPSYQGSYQRSAVTVKNHLSENPEITVCLDIHRDAIEPSASEIIKPTAVINGKKAAQIMIISGCDDGTMDMPGYWENLRFAAALADKLEELYPGLCRPVLFDYRKYNMDLSPGLLLIEIGATGNTLDEAKYSAELLGNALCELFSE
jgi:stage II sporulation protein P